MIRNMRIVSCKKKMQGLWSINPMKCFAKRAGCIWTKSISKDGKAILKVQRDLFKVLNVKNVNVDCSGLHPQTTPAPPRPPIVLKFIGIIFYLFIYDSKNENKSELELQCDFKNGNREFGFDIGGEWLPDTPTPASCHHATLSNFTNSRVESRPQLVSTGDICDGSNIISDDVNENNNENFDDNEYEYGVLLLLPGLTDIPRPATGDSNEIDTGVCKLNIFKDVFGFIYVKVILLMKYLMKYLMK